MLIVVAWGLVDGSLAQGVFFLCDFYMYGYLFVMFQVPRDYPGICFTIHCGHIHVSLTQRQLHRDCRTDVWPKRAEHGTPVTLPKPGPSSRLVEVQVIFETGKLHLQW
jgi:hypothetical protein